MGSGIRVLLFTLTLTLPLRDANISYTISQNFFVLFLVPNLPDQRRSEPGRVQEEVWGLLLLKSLP